MATFCRTITITIAICFMVAAWSVHVQADVPLPVLNKTGESLEEFIPDGWQLVGKPAEGDLDKDGKHDIVAAIEKAYDEDETPRILLLLFRNKTNDGYVLAASNSAILMPVSPAGEPLQELTIKNRVVTIQHYTGLNTRWWDTYKLRYQNQDWYLIGAKEGSLDILTQEGYEEDYNLLTGAGVISTLAGGKPVKKKSKKTAVDPRIKLMDIKDVSALWKQIQER